MPIKAVIVSFVCSQLLIKEVRISLLTSPVSKTELAGRHRGRQVNNTSRQKR